MLKKLLKNNKGEAYTGQAVKIVIAVVLGAAILAGGILAFNQLILPHTEGYIETLFGKADGLTDDSSSSYASLIAYIQNGLNSMSEEEWADIEAEMNEIYAENPDYFPENFEPSNVRDAEVFMNVAYSSSRNMTYDEAVAYSQTKEGQEDYASFFADWFEG